MNVVQFKQPDLSLLKQEYLVADLHHHTKYSHDSNTSVSHILDQAEEQGIFVAITDHNSISGVLKAFESPRGKKLVIPGIEIATKEKKDVLIYFYNVLDLKRFFVTKVKPHLQNKNSLRLSTSTYKMESLLHDLNEERCVVALPHPVCARIKSTYHYFSRENHEELLQYVHAIEVINKTMTHRNNLTALGWALSLNKPITAGSDGHRPDTLGTAVTAAKARTKSEFLDAIKAGETIVRGKELRMNERLTAGLHLVAEKAKMRNNMKIDREYA